MLKAADARLVVMLNDGVKAAGLRAWRMNADHITVALRLAHHSLVRADKLSVEITNPGRGDFARREIHHDAMQLRTRKRRGCINQREWVEVFDTSRKSGLDCAGR